MPNDTAYLYAPFLAQVVFYLQEAVEHSTLNDDFRDGSIFRDEKWVFSKKSFLGREMISNDGWLPISILARMPRIVRLTKLFGMKLERMIFLSDLLELYSRCEACRLRQQAGAYQLSSEECDCKEYPFSMNTHRTHIRPRNARYFVRAPSLSSTPSDSRDSCTLYFVRICMSIVYLCL